MAYVSSIVIKHVGSDNNSINRDSQSLNWSSAMKCNVGNLDRNIRIVLGFVVILAGIALNSWWGAIGAIFLLTGIFAWCPLYALFHLNTEKQHRPKMV